MNIPVFPLPIFILPNGITRLRIFEQRYLKMVKIASKENGFAIQCLNKNGDEDNLASWVEIVNFDTTDQGILQIDVKCSSLVTLTSTGSDSDHLKWANVDVYCHWSIQEHNDVTLALSQLLRSFFQQNPELFDLYHQNFIEQANWVVARWLELLPISNQYKALFFKPNSYNQAVSFLADLLLTKNEKKLI